MGFSSSHAFYETFYDIDLVNTTITFNTTITVICNGSAPATSDNIWGDFYA